MTMKTEKVTVSLPADTIALADEKHQAFGFQNRSEFINAAIREYISRDILRQFTGELTEIYQQIERSEIKELEQHLSKLTYKIAVELAQIHMLLATGMEIPYDIDRSLRGKAVKLVNQHKGFVPLSKAAQCAEALPESF